MPAHEYKGAAEQLTLSANITDTALSFTSVETPGGGWPTGNVGQFVVRIDNEKILCGNRTTNVFGVITRGYDGTAAVAHSGGVATIRHVLDALTLQRHEDHLFDLTDSHPASSITNTPAGSIGAVTVQAAIDELATEKQPVGNYVNKADYNVSTILAADADDSPLPLTIPLSTLVGRKAAGGIAALTPAEAKAILAILSTDISDFVNAVRAAIQPGMMFDFAGAVAPTGYLLCDGTTVSRTTYAALFAVIGTSWNTGGELGTDFRLPDFRGRVAVGSGTGTGLTARTLAQVLGEETHGLSIAELAAHSHVQNPHNHTTQAHSHSITDPGHWHYTPEGMFGSGFIDVGPGGRGTLNRTGQDPTGITGTNPQGVSVDNGTATNQNTGSGTPHNVMQPSAVVTKIIKT